MSPVPSAFPKFQAFLNASVEDPALFSRLLLAAAFELRADELRTSFAELAFKGDQGAVNELNARSLRPARSTFEDARHFDIAPHLSRVCAQWEQTGSATLFRGTRLPDPGGSFGFGVHVTPQIDIAGAYASGASNSSTGIGRLGKRNGIGFVHAYDVSLEEKTYRNFQFEDALADPTRAAKTSLRDLLQSMKALSQEPNANFYVTPEGIASEVWGRWNALAGKSEHYEVVLNSARQPKASYLLHSMGLIKINAQDQRWDLLLARVQEASLRDFYEIIPLERALQALTHARGRAEGDADRLALIEQVRGWVSAEKQRRTEAPWEATSLSDVALHGSAYLAQRPYIAQSERVGSAMDGVRIVKPGVVGMLLDLSTSLQVGDDEQVGKLLKVLPSQFCPASGAAGVSAISPKASPAANSTQEARLIGAMAASAAHAARQADSSVRRLNEHALVYATGQDTGRAAYESLSQAGYLAAYDLLTYGDTCAALGVHPSEHCDQIITAGVDLFARVQEHEEAYLANALSPSAVFYDDLLHPQTWMRPHDPVTLHPRPTVSRQDEYDVPVPALAY